jgi:heme/copper-type cytochrome/quinol oxidase subunit 4
MKKAIPILYCTFIYLVLACLFFIEVDPGPFVMVGGVLILAVLNIVCAIHLNKEEDQETLRFSMIFTTYGLLPFYLTSIWFFGILAILASDFDNGILTMLLIAIAVNGSVRLGSAFYMYFHIKQKGYSKVHRILSFLPLLSAADLTYLLIRYRGEGDLKETDR